MSGDGTIKIWRIATGVLVFQAFVAVGPNRCGQRVSADAVMAGVNNVVQKVSVRNGAVEFTHHGHEAAIQVCDVANSRRWLISGDASGVVRVWDTTVSSTTPASELMPAQFVEAGVLVKDGKAFVRMVDGALVPVHLEVTGHTALTTVIAPDRTWGVIAIDNRLKNQEEESGNLGAGGREPPCTRPSAVSPSP